MGTIDPKAFAGTLGGAISTVLWVLLGAFVDPISDLGAETLAVLIGASGVIFTGALSYLTPNAASPVKGDGAGIEQTIEEFAGKAGDPS